MMFRWLQAQFFALSPYGVAAALLLTLNRLPINETLNLVFYDLVTSLRPAPSGIDKSILLIGIDEGDIRRFGWPIDDRLLCEAVDRLLQNGALAIGLDIYRDKGVGPNQECLRQRFRDDPRLVSIFNVAEAIGPVPGTPQGRRGYNDLVVDPDGVVRRDLVHVSGQDESTVSLPLRVLEVGMGARWLSHQLENDMAPGPWLEEQSSGYDQLDASGYQQMLEFRRLGTFPQWSLRDLLAGNRIPPGQISNQLVLIGSTAPSLRDLFPVPQTRFTLGKRQLLVPGVELHAHRLASLIDRKDGYRSHPIFTVPMWAKRLLELAAIVLGIALGEGLRNLLSSVLAVAVSLLAIVAMATALLLYGYVWVGVSMPVISLGLVAAAAWVRLGATSQLQRRQFERLLGQTTSPAVAKQLWDQREDLLKDGRFEGRQLQVTVMLTDIAGFTTISEGLPPAELLAWLNRGMACLVKAISGRQGMVNKFTGDGVLAVFGAPMSQGSKTDARAAIDAALAIQIELTILNRQLEAQGQPLMRMRMGIHSGPVLAGSIGSSERLEYAVIGDTVNCASRLESLDKDRHDTTCRVLVTSSTRELLPDDLPVNWRAWGAVQVKGRNEPLEVWEMRGRGSS